MSMHTFDQWRREEIHKRIMKKKIPICTRTHVYNIIMVTATWVLQEFSASMEEAVGGAGRVDLLSRHKNYSHTDVILIFKKLKY